MPSKLKSAILNVIHHRRAETRTTRESQQFVKIFEETAGFIEEVDDVDSDASSEISSSSMATVDDNPGTGRVIDKYVYQKGGRKIEQIVSRLRLPYLSTGHHLECITRYKEVHKAYFGIGGTEDLDSALQAFHGPYMTYVVNGLKVLLKRSR